MAGRRGFIVLEGGEGAGKTRLLARLGEMLVADGYDVVATQEPGGTQEGLALRAMLLAAHGIAWDPGAELLLMTAARVQHVKHVILPALSAGRVVLCDRFIGSTLAYQGGGRGLDEAWIMDLHERFVGGLMPDITVLLDIDPEMGLERSRRRLALDRTNEGRFEALELDFHRRVRQSFLDRVDSTTILLDAGRDPDLLSMEAWRALKAVLGGRGQSSPAA